MNLTNKFNIIYPNNLFASKKHDYTYVIQLSLLSTNLWFYSLTLLLHIHNGKCMNISEFIKERGIRKTIGLPLGLILAIGIQLIPMPNTLLASIANQGFSGDEAIVAARSAWVVLSLMVLMATWWITEAIPIPVTALLPMIVLPIAGVSPIKDVGPTYLHQVVVLLMGGFIVAKSVEHWHLHERIALQIVNQIGGKPVRLVAGFMIASVLLSMWISNTATTLMMIPIAMSVSMAILGEEKVDSALTWALLLGIAYSASIGGLGTPIGTPTNLIVADQISVSTGTQIDFTTWMLFGVPSVLFLVTVAYLVLTRVVFRLPHDLSNKGDEIIRNKLTALGKITTPELRVIGVFAVIATLWMFGRPLREFTIVGIQPLGGLTDHVTAIIGVLLVFLVPSGSKVEKGSALLNWKTAETIPWGVLLVFGSGMALAAVIRSSGLSGWVGEELSILTNLHPFVLILIITAIVIFVTEITSNVATAAALTPVLVSVAEGTSNLDVIQLAAPVALAASCAFMFPMATGPNAVAYATGHVTLPVMARAGFYLNLIAIMVISMIAYFWAPQVLGQ